LAARADERTARAFAEEVARLRAANVPGEGGRLRELFDFLADRGADAAPASQAEIADTVFGQPDAAGDDATVRVYIHRLRKRLDEYYTRHGDGPSRLVIPAGAYVLRLAGPESEEVSPAALGRRRLHPAWLAVAAVALLAATFLAGRWAAPDGPAVNALWQPFVSSNRPLAIVLGDYYIYGEIDPLNPERSRLIRDFSVNSPEDLALAQQAEPGRYGAGEDVGLNYLPFSSAYGMAALTPVLARHRQPVRIIPASQLDADTLRNDDIIYVGLISGLGMLEDAVFANAGFEVGSSYDELVDTGAGRSYVSEEARQLVTSALYKDYGFVTRFRSASGGLVAVVAGTRETGLRGVSPIVAGKLPAQVDELAKGGNFVALFEVTGQKGADLSERLLQARARK
jgi:hypothetical protein